MKAIGPNDPMQKSDGPSKEVRLKRVSTALCNILLDKIDAFDKAPKGSKASKADS